MAVEVILCPACKHQLRVPESLFGEPVTCPQCRNTFLAPKRQADGTIGQPESLPQSPAGKPGKKSSSPLLFPGLVLLLVGMMGLFSNGLIVYRVTKNPDQFVDEAMKNLENPTFRKAVGDREIQRDEIKDTALPRIQLWCIPLACLSLVVVAGAIGMITQRFFWLAVLGSGIAIIDLPCCCLGLPAGIFGLVKLFDPDSRALFRR